jgi:uncharacterized repeat protein (TIGR03803 family)
MKTRLPKIALLLFACISFGLAIVNAQPSEFYGMSRSGGEYSAGTIFKTDSNGDNFNSVFTFFSYDGSTPFSSLCKAGNGKLYGVTYFGGADDYGVLFEWDPATSTYTKKLDFNGTEKGSHPWGSLMQAENGKLYGMTHWGGVNDLGVLFEWDPVNNAFAKKLDFNGVGNGRNPQGSLMEAGNGKLYGMTVFGGANDLGVLFEWDPVTNTYAKKLDFNGDLNGSVPYRSLIQADNGRLYGLTSQGGENDFGVLFEWDPATDTYSKKIDFNGSENGSNPIGSLVKANNGILYGTTTYGGTNGLGVLFEWDPTTDIYTKKLDFSAEIKGGYPHGSLVQINNGKLYGMTGNIIYEWDPVTNIFTNKYSFEPDSTGSGGRSPQGSLVLADNGKLYGMTMEGGVASCCQSGDGILFEWDPATDTFTKKMDFNRADNGRFPTDLLVRGNNGKLYGMTHFGGEYDDGVLFEWNPATNTFAKKLDFNGAENGSNPLGSLMLADNGKLYGMAGGGFEGCGVLFEWDPATDTYVKKLAFNGAEEGCSPYASLIQADNGKLYGTTGYGGKNTLGVLFEWDPATNIYIKKLDFNGAENGSNPYGSLLQADNGKLYGMTYRGGAHDYGVLYEWDPATDTYTKKLDFNGTGNGSNPFGSLIQANDGKLYGMTESGGINDLGVLFEWDPATDSYTKKIDFNGAEYGLYPRGSLMLATNGKLYGITSREHKNDMGVLFEWDPVTGIFTKKLDYTGEKNGNYLQNSQVKQDKEALPGMIDKKGNAKKKELNGSGASDFHGSLMEVIYEIHSKLNAETCDSYISPSGSYTWTISGIYNDTIPSVAGYNSIITVNLTIHNADASVTQNQSVLMAHASEAIYQWIDCNSDKRAIAGETHQTFEAKTDGNYAVIVTENGCTDTSSCFSVIPTGQIINTFKHNLTLYPNPNDGSFSIDLGSIYPDAEISISRLDGRIIRKEYIINARSKYFQLSEPPGLYLVTIISENERAVFKVTMK